MVGTVSDRSSPSAGRYLRWRICADMGGGLEEFLGVGLVGCRLEEERIDDSCYPLCQE
jgi:hypothetical protein